MYRRIILLSYFLNSTKIINARNVSVTKSRNCSKTVSRPAGDFLQRGKNTSFLALLLLLNATSSLWKGQYFKALGGSWSNISVFALHLLQRNVSEKHWGHTSPRRWWSPDFTTLCFREFSLHKEADIKNTKDKLRSKQNPLKDGMWRSTRSTYLLPSGHKLLAAGSHEMRMHGDDLQGNKDPQQWFRSHSSSTEWKPFVRYRQHDLKINPVSW